MRGGRRRSVPPFSLGDVVSLFTYGVSSIRVIDGDTIEATVDQGFRTYRRETFRLARINAPERDTHDGVVAKAALEGLLKDQVVTVQSKKTEKYGRWLAEVWVAAGNVNDLLVEGGFAAYAGKVKA